MEIQIKPIILGFFFTLILLPFINAIAPLISGITVGYLVGGNYRNGIINGGLIGSLAALTYAILVDLLFLGAVVARAQSTGLSVETVIVLSLVLAPIGGLLLGLIGGIIGVAIKKKKWIIRKSILQNAYSFTIPFSTKIVQPKAYAFIICWTFSITGLMSIFFSVNLYYIPF